MKGRERYGHDDREVDSPMKIQAWFRASMRRCSSNTEDLLKPGSVFEHRLWCHGASSLGMRREVRRGKFLRKNFSEKWSVTGEAPTVITTLRWIGQCTGRRGPLRQLICGTATESWMMSFENKWNVFSFLVFITQFLSNRITKPGWPNMSDGVQTKCFSWTPPILDDEWWKKDHITQNSLHPNNL